MGLVVSDVERTVLDAFRRPEFSGGMPGAVRVLERALPRLDGARLGRYLARIQNESLGRRIGYVADLFRRTSAVRSRWVEELLPSQDAPYVSLGPAREYGRRGTHHARWRVVRNVPEDRLLGETRIR
jgi:predicted transcriptional regulator of viral defense system